MHASILMPTYTVRKLIEMRIGPALAAADLDPCNYVNGSRRLLKLGVAHTPPSERSEVERVSLVRCRPLPPDTSTEVRGSQSISGSTR
jgi:hypothetical protein